MKYLIDTCVISELVKPFPNKSVISWLKGLPSERVYLSVITIAELRRGVKKLNPSKKKNKLTEWLNSLIEDYQDRILPVNLEVAETWGEILAAAENRGHPISSMDGMIASIARNFRLTLVTRNEKDFVGCDIPIFNPWTTK